MGMLLMAGPRVRQGARIEGASVYDIAPTMLTMLGMPRARDMSGRVLEEALRTEMFPEELLKGSVRTYEHREPIPRVEGSQDQEADEEMRKRLRSLGYIE